MCIATSSVRLLVCSKKRGSDGGIQLFGLERAEAPSLRDTSLIRVYRVKSELIGNQLSVFR
jgi:hypothetical protein